MSVSWGRNVTGCDPVAGRVQVAGATGVVMVGSQPDSSKAGRMTPIHRLRMSPPKVLERIDLLHPLRSRDPVARVEGVNAGTVALALRESQERRCIASKELVRQALEHRVLRRQICFNLRERRFESGQVTPHVALDQAHLPVAAV